MARDRLDDLGTDEPDDDLGDDELADDEVDVDDDVEVDDEADVANPDAKDGTSLDELLAQRAATRPAGDETDDDTTDIISFGAGDAEPTDVDVTPAKVAPIKDREEFVCKRCYLVKPKVQLADPERMFCRDCA